MNVRQTEMAALVFEGQASMIDAKCMQDRGVQIVYMNRVLGYVIGVIIRFSDADPWLDAASGHPNGETPRMVVAPVIVSG
jgi:hypothetical protein